MRRRRASVCGPVRSLRIALLAVMALVLAAYGRPALALESAKVVTPQTTAALLSDTDQVAPGVTLHLGLLLNLAPGWHVYWKNPGQAGLPPSVQLDLPQEARSGAIAWPAPERLKEGPLVVYAYSGQVLLSLPVTPAAGSYGLTVRAEANWLVCKDVCIPQRARFQLDLSAGPPASSAQASLFAEAERSVPRLAPWSATVAPDGTLAVLGPELGPGTVQGAAFFPDNEGSIVDAASQHLRSAPGGLALTLEPGKAFRPSEGLSGVLLLRDRSGLSSAVAIRAVPGPVPAILATPPLRLWRLWILALAGG